MVDALKVALSTSRKVNNTQATKKLHKDYREAKKLLPEVPEKILFKSGRRYEYVPELHVAKRYGGDHMTNIRMKSRSKLFCHIGFRLVPTRRWRENRCRFAP